MTKIFRSLSKYGKDLNIFVSPYHYQYQIGLFKVALEPTRPTSTDLPALPLPLTNKANAGNQNANGVPMPLRCKHRRRKSETESSRTKLMNVYSFQMLGYGIVYRVSILIFLLKRRCFRYYYN